MKKIKNKSAIETFLPAFKGYYGSFWDDDYMFEGEAEHYELPRNFPFWEFFDYSAWHNDLSKAITDLVEDKLKEAGFVKSIKYQSLYSPKEYNFKNDSINCEIVPVPKAIAKYIYANVDRFKQYLIDHLKSRDGFISFHSHYFDDWEEMTNKFTKYNDDRGFHLGFLLNFICEDTELFGLYDDSWSIEQYNYTQNNVYVGNYYTKEFDTIVDLKENASAVDLDYLVKDAGWRIVDNLTKINEVLSRVRNRIQTYYTTNLVNLDSIMKYLENDEDYSDIELYVNMPEFVESEIAKIDWQKQQTTLDLK